MDLQCSTCRMWLDDIDFNVDRSKPSGFKSQCKYCRTEAREEAKLLLTNNRIVLKALRVGTITLKPCEACNADHAEYSIPNPSQPLNLLWLCSACRDKQAPLTVNRQMLKERKKTYNKLYYGLKVGKISPKPCEVCRIAQNTDFYIDEQNIVFWYCSQHYLNKVLA